MRTAIFSDIHANLEALEATREALQDIPHDRVVCLGDLVGYGADPEECVGIVKKEGWATVKGNHDAAINEPEYMAMMNHIAYAALEWTAQNLSDGAKQFLHSLPMTLDIDENAVACHGLPFNPKEWIYSDNVNMVMTNFLTVEKDYCFVGHLHYAHSYKFQPEDNKLFVTHLPESVDLSEGRRLLNVGSVGQPRDEDHRACLVIYDSDKKTADYHRIQYDTVEAARKIVDAGLPEVLAQRLFLGR